MYNTPEYWRLTATVTDRDREAFWMAALNTNTVPILSPDPIIAKVPERGVVSVYLLDLMALSEGQVESLARHIAERFFLAYESVLADIRCGMPILAENVVVRLAGKVVEP